MALTRSRPTQPLTPAAIAEAKALLGGATYAALATLEPGSGNPQASRVGLSTLPDGTPILIASGLTAHGGALEADPRCGLLVGEVGKGDPLAHPRLMLTCRAEAIAAGSPDAALARARYLATHPKAALYVDLPDFRFYRLAVERGSYNGGFGRAYDIERDTLRG